MGKNLDHTISYVRRIYPLRGRLKVHATQAPKEQPGAFDTRLRKRRGIFCNDLLVPMMPNGNIILPVDTL